MHAVRKNFHGARGAYQVQMLEDKLMETEHLIVETATNMAREKEDIWVREKATLQVNKQAKVQGRPCMGLSVLPLWDNEERRLGVRGLQTWLVIRVQVACPRSRQFNKRSANTAQ